jgi:hypothetical protein
MPSPQRRRSEERRDTPPPWFVESRKDVLFVNWRDPATGNVWPIGQVYLGPESTQGLANARLIAAAPELLDDLDLLLCLISVNGPDVGIISDPHTIRTIHKARTAVAKATGEKLA